ncbi:hypothetical protein BDP55DRAFT_666712 [Colletotrichum godetiae]|uniref:Uncharacterized protein n=1 Tax=Colletotrichum godetiae TaxID=1209918 RepID=A0AAJ0ET12_9PEZI|nr:uncharacterized protein BDP55DRAFT_666712 [Colletotrichum godetiae]KAK1674512.1 hypothetical protein BDP55DRAFT_666712 [Colletotrichum godetiae]
MQNEESLFKGLVTKKRGITEQYIKRPDLKQHEQNLAVRLTVVVPLATLPLSLLFLSLTHTLHTVAKAQDSRADSAESFSSVFVSPKFPPQANRRIRAVARTVRLLNLVFCSPALLCYTLLCCTVIPSVVPRLYTHSAPWRDPSLHWSLSPVHFLSRAAATAHK